MTMHNGPSYRKGNKLHLPTLSMNNPAGYSVGYYAGFCDKTSKYDPADHMYHASPTARVIPSDHSVDADHNFPLDRADQTVRTDPSDHPDRTARAVHRIDPHTDSQARFNLGLEESEDVHRFSLMALLVRYACPEGCPDVLASVPDPLIDFSHPYFTKAWKLSCLKTCLTPVHILVMKINRRVMWSVRRVCGSSCVCPILPIMDLHDQSHPGHQLNSHFRPDLEIKIKHLFLVGPVRHIRQQIEFCFLVGPVSHIRRKSSTQVESLGHPQLFVSPFIPSVLVPFRLSPYLSFPVECSFLRAHHKVASRNPFGCATAYILGQYWETL
ncbi:hypothetical protein DY000_02014326 [Brassica cretica]|uniref:Neprosin domain-containing protein n=1 Tax=Brassica cretica TaxID=69181 RepID=A0ABQ7CXS5_BRACR|nr:hypothetical protein DY000_02014326 [Brassica cretica]